MNTFNHKNRNRFEGSHLIGLLLITLAVISGLISIFLPLNPPFNDLIPLTICLLVLGLLFIYIYTGIEINYAKKAFRHYTYFCGIKLGEWTSMPAISKMKLRSVSNTSINTRNGISPTLSGTIQAHRVILYANQPTPLLAFSFSKREEGLKNTELLASYLDSEIEIE